MTRIEKSGCISGSASVMRLLSCMFIALAVSIPASFAGGVSGISGSTCLEQTTNVSCNANDVRVGELEVIGDPQSCTEGDPVTVLLQATIESGPEKYDVGLWINESGGSAEDDSDGTCFRDILSPAAVMQDGACNQTGGPYANGDGDACGDVPKTPGDCTDTVVMPCTEGGGDCVFTTYTFSATLTCTDSNGDGNADAGTCTSWSQSADDNCSNALQAIPGAPSKCNCSSIEIQGLTTGCQSDTECDDGEFCNGAEACNMDSGECEPGAVSCGDDGNFCNGAESCNETDDQCESSGNPCGDDGEYCNGTESCNETDDQCESSGDPCGDDGEYCNGTESCNETDDQCESSGDPCGDDGEYCNGTESCNETDDQCESSGDPCGDDGEYCNGTESCNETDDQCESSGDPCGDDGEYCNGTESCNEADDQCESSGDPCQLDNECDGSVACDEFDDECVCSNDICRTPGFWGTHPTETEAMLAWANMDEPIEACGIQVFDFPCAAEGLCSRPKGDKRIITARHLLAAALNCHLTNGSIDCSGTEIETLFADCDAACLNNDVSAMNACRPEVDCYNNGGQILEGIGCALGRCSVNDVPCGMDAGDCAFIEGESGDNTNVCVAFAGNCHEMPLVNELLGFDFEPPSPADPEVCQDALRSRDDLFDDSVCPQIP